ncbi:MAG: flagellar basal body rod protein FlgB [Gammaproteobacteria bacterium]
MALDINGQFDLHTRALGIANQRLELLADNVANADTPNYKARDIDFRTAMANAGQPGALGGDLPLASTRAGHIQVGGAGPNTTNPLYRVPDQPSLDGNTVDSQKENAAIAETSVRYQATLTFLSSRIRGLRDAITGGR